jgi:hypothetical protein
MNTKHIKQNPMTGAIVFAVLGILAGVLLIAMPIELLINIVFVVMGIITVAYSLPTMLASLALLSSTAGKVTFVLSAVSVAVGAVMIFWHNSVLLILLGIYMILLPLINVLLSSDRSAAIKAELPKLILGVVMVVLGPAGVLGILFDIAGVCLIVWSVVYAVSMYAALRKSQHTTGARVFVDTDGNGSIDTVYVDTTGDGKADTATHYKEEQ